MKRILVLIMVCVMPFAFTGCKDDIKKVDESKVQIVTTIFPLYDFAREVAGDRAQVTLLLPTGAEVHSYEPTAHDIIKIKESDLFINLGMEADPWTDAVINDADGKKLNVLSSMECVEIMLEDGDAHSSHVHADPHIWTSPKNAMKIVQAICDKLCSIDSENAGYYKENSERYIESLSGLDKEFKELFFGKNAVLVFADRFPFRYFADEYEIGYYAAYPGCSSESEPSAADISKLIDTVKNENIPIIFYTETSNMQLPNTVSEETGAECRLLHSCHTVTKGQMNKKITYLDLMMKNYEALKDALK